MRKTSPEYINPWADRNNRPRLPLKAVIINAMTVVLCAIFPAAYFAFGSYQLFSLASLLIICCAAATLIISSYSPLMPILTGAGALIAGFLTQNMAVAAILLSAVTVISTGGMLVCLTSGDNRKIVYSILPVSYMLAFCATGFQPVTALLSLIFFPAALALGILTLSDKSRVGVICAVSALIFIPIAVILLFAFYRSYGEISVALIQDFFTGLKANIVDEIMREFTEMFENPLMSNVGAENPITRDMIDDAVTTLINNLPALSICLCNMIAYLSQGLLTSKFRKLGVAKFITAHSAVFIMSPASAVVFLVSFIVILFTTVDGNTAVQVAAYTSSNVFTVLTPGLALVGLISQIYGKPHGRARIFTIVIIAVSAAIFGSYTLIILAFLGAVAIIVSVIRQRINSDKNKKGDGI